MGPDRHAVQALVRAMVTARASATRVGMSIRTARNIVREGAVVSMPAQIQLHAARIRERAVVTRTMPPANKTYITDLERAILARWIEQGARVP